MLAPALLLSFFLVGSDGLDRGAIAAVVTSPRATANQPQDDQEAEYERRRKAAEGNAKKLWEVANWCEANGLTKEFRSCLRAILKLDDSDKKAHELLGHVAYDGQWFTSEKKMEVYKKKREAQIRKAEEKRAKEEGLIKHKGQWVRPEEVPLLEKGYVKDESGTWVDPEEQKKLADGWVRQDLEWIAPDEKDNIDQGLWKCGEQWLSLEKANAYHAEVEQCWKIPGQRFVAFSTCDRKTSERALREAEDAYADLVRIFGVHPPDRPHFLILKNRDQYSSFAAGDASEQRMGAESQGLSSVHGACFADTWFDLRAMKFLGAGVSYWDVDDERESQFGRLWARHAAGQSFVEQIDPSHETLNKLFESMGASGYSPEAYWDEKFLPRWLRWGAATYVERYSVDKSAGAASNPYQLREWSVANIQSAGGLDALDAILEFGISVEDPEGSRKLLNEAGLLVAFLVDGACEPLQKNHEALKAAILKARQDPKQAKSVARAIAKLEKTLKSKEDELRAFAKL